MTRPILALAALAAALWGANAALDARSTEPVRAGAGLERLFDEASTQGRPVAAVAVAWPRRGIGFTYFRSQGVWRCLEAFRAPCDGARVEALIRGVARERGVVRGEGAEAGATFGMDGEDAVEVSLHGTRVSADPARDEIARARFGAPRRVDGGASAAGCFTRAAGTERVLEVDFDPREVLGEGPRTGFPPLLDLRIVPQDFPGTGRAVDLVRVERAGEEPFDLARRERQADEPPAPDDPASAFPWEWRILRGDEALAIPPLRGEAYATFALRAPYFGLEDPARAAELAGSGAQGAGRITLVSSAGESLELWVGPPAPAGGRYVWNPSAILLFVVDDASAQMLLPAPEAFTDEKAPNRWDEWLRARMRRR